jgi:hypothetical protein
MILKLIKTTAENILIMNSRNKFSDRSDTAPHDADRPEWQQERGERYGNRRKEISRLKWKDRRKQRLKEKNLDFD